MYAVIILLNYIHLFSLSEPSSSSQHISAIPRNFDIDFKTSRVYNLKKTGLKF